MKTRNEIVDRILAYIDLDPEHIMSNGQTAYERAITLLEGLLDELEIDS